MVYLDCLESEKVKLEQEIEAMKHEHDSRVTELKNEQIEAQDRHERRLRQLVVEHEEEATITNKNHQEEVRYKP